MDEPERTKPQLGQTASRVADQAQEAGETARKRGADIASDAQTRAADVASTARDRGSDLAQEAGERATRVAGAAAERAGKVIEQARQGVSEVGQTVQNRLNELGDRRDQAAETVEAVAGDVHKAADTLRQADQLWLSQMVEAGASELGAVAEMIRSNDLNAIMQRVRGVAHRQPALFAGASVAAGFALARMARVALEQPASGGRDWYDRPAGQSSASRAQPVALSTSEPPTTGRDGASTPPGTTYPGTTYNG